MKHSDRTAKYGLVCEQGGWKQLLMTTSPEYCGRHQTVDNLSDGQS